MALLLSSALQTYPQGFTQGFEQFQNSTSSNYNLARIPASSHYAYPYYHDLAKMGKTVMSTQFASLGIGLSTGLLICLLFDKSITKKPD